MIILILLSVMSLSAIVMALLLISTSKKVNLISEEEIAQYSLSPYFKGMLGSGFSAVYSFIISFFKGLLHALASLSKHIHLISTRSIARIEKAISSAEEELGDDEEKEDRLIEKKEEEKIPD